MQELAEGALGGVVVGHGAIGPYGAVGWTVRVWEAALAFWPPCTAYQRRVEREIRLFRLERR
ncbi:hypothetical protein GCM10010253_47310 [Streptomyces badius]|uniref:Uncharacterized protein n=1 Tax=Streptomyces badius TaxID=1941 RepID=A0ABQ2TEQ6_STRBA|nr:hypothetical protein GCM10010253_47310 [Streptomyces badius]